MAGLGFVGGLGMGFAFVALWGLVRPTVRNDSDIAALGRMVIGAGSVETPDSNVHGLRNTLHLALARQGAEQGRVVGVIGAGREQGVTTLALALARSFQGAGSRTAIVDANLRNPTLSVLLGAQGQLGLADWSRSARPDALPLSSVEGLALLPAGREPKGEDHLLGLRDAGRVMDSLSGAHDIVVSDCGAAVHTLSSTLFAAQCDIVVLVLRRGIALHAASSAVAAILATSRRQVLVVLTGKQAGLAPAWVVEKARPAWTAIRALVSRQSPIWSRK
jgi:Mrp family chromosome partitioning ATPase